MFRATIKNERYAQGCATPGIGSDNRTDPRHPYRGGVEALPQALKQHMSMAKDSTIKEILDVATRKDLMEVGGSHNQKGVDFQCYWALMRVIQLEQSGQDDFLFLFEAIQDVAEFDSSVAPSLVRVYQVKKKDRGEWTWAGLTKLPAPTGKQPLLPKPLVEVKESPLGKLYASVIAFRQMRSTGHFISNAGCDLPLIGGGNAATSLPCSLFSLEQAHQSLLTDGLATLHEAGMPLPDLNRIHVERVALPPDDPRTYLIGVVAEFLGERSPRHAGQARSLVDSLMAKIGPLGRRTEACMTFNEMKARRGFSSKEFRKALGDFAEIPDSLTYLDHWLNQLSNEGMDFLESTSIKVAAAGFYRRQVMGGHTEQEEALIQDCDQWIELHRQTGKLREFFAKAYGDLNARHSSFKKPELLAHFALRAIKKCVDPI